MRNAIKRIIWFCLGLLLLTGLFTIQPVWSMENRAGEQVVISANEVINDDLYVSGNTITIDGTVKGDLIAAGRQITINGTVEQDLIAAGQAVIINGKVNDDVRIAGQVLQLGSKAEITDDLVAAGYSLETKVGSSVGGDLSFGGAQALLAGNVKQNILAAMSSLELRGKVDGNIKVRVGGEKGEPKPLILPFLPPPPISAPQISSGITITDSGQIGGELRYESTTDPIISPSAKIERQIRESIQEAWEKPSPTAMALHFLQRWLTLLIVGWVLLWVVPNWTQSMANTVKSRPLPSLGWGVVTWLGVIVAISVIAIVTIFLSMLLGVTITGLVPLTLGIGFLSNFAIFIGFLLYISYIPQVLVSFLGGKLLLQKMQPNWAEGKMAPLVVGLLIFILLSAIPVLGLLVNLVTVFLGLGALWLWGRTILKPTSDRPMATV